MIKTSKKLDKLCAELFKLDDDAFGSDVVQGADKICTENSNDYRACDYAEYIEAGIDMVKKSNKTGDPIFRIDLSYSRENMILFYVGKLDDIAFQFEEAIKAVRLEMEDEEEDEIMELEERLQVLKSKKKLPKKAASKKKKTRTVIDDRQIYCRQVPECTCGECRGGNPILIN